MNFERIVIIICIINFALVGAIGVINHQWLASTIGLSLNTDLAHSEVVALYGGLQIGLSVFFAMAYKRITWHEPALYVAALIIGGIAFGRVIAALRVGVPESSVMAVFVIEVIVTTVIIMCLRNMAKRNHQENA